MGIYDALQTAVSGLRAQSVALENISGNIANSRTTGYKRVDTTFSDLVPDFAHPTRQTSGATDARSRPTNIVQGDLEASSVATHMAVSGSEWFVVGRRTDYVDGKPVFETSPLFTRRGDFTLDKDGYLINGAGYYMQAIPNDPVTGNPIGSEPQILQYGRDLLQASVTTRIEYRANLAKYPTTAVSTQGDPASSLFVWDAGLPAAPATQPPGSTPLTNGVVSANQEPSFLDRTVSGGAITIFDSSGANVNVSLRWAKTANGDPAASPVTYDQWRLFLSSDPNATGDGIAWRAAGVTGGAPEGATFQFDSRGLLQGGISSIDLSAGMFGGTQFLSPIQFEFGDGLTSFTDTNGSVKVNSLNQNGYGAGEIQSLNVSEDGKVVGNYSNGRTISLSTIVLADFVSPNLLQKVDSGAYRATFESGPPLYTTTGQVFGGSLETSNTDLAEEFTKLITTQQAYSANTRIVSTSNDMMRETLNMVQ